MAKAITLDQFNIITLILVAALKYQIVCVGITSESNINIFRIKKMKRFNLPLSDYIYDEFYRCFPDHGARTALLRTTVQRLIQRAKLKTGQVYKTDAVEIADKLEYEEG
jgi:hypothetical protein